MRLNGFVHKACPNSPLSINRIDVVSPQPGHGNVVILRKGQTTKPSPSPYDMFIAIHRYAESNKIAVKSRKARFDLKEPNGDYAYQ